jgi:pSer/pThr/pTyr-binding forkhead associated (FHA) protein
VQVTLVIAKGQHAGKVIPVKKKQFVIGRHRDCQLSVSSSKISVHHCAILLRKKSVWLRDFDSTNGTFLNGERVSGECELHHGDRVRIGSLTFEVHVDGDAPDPKESMHSTKKVRAVSEDKAASLLHKQSWSEIDEGILTTGPDSAYELTDLKTPAVPASPEEPDE